MNLDPSEIVEKNVFTKTPFYRGEVARNFFRAVKANETEKVMDFVANDKFIIYEHDEQDLTALHWAAKRDHIKIIKFLI